MPIEHTLAVLPVRDLEEAVEWYGRFFGAPPTNRPMPTLAEWQVTPGGWLQLTVDGHRAGMGYANFAVDDLSASRSELAERGLAPGPVVPANRGVELSSLSDPDGNTITIIGGFRPVY